MKRAVAMALGLGVAVLGLAAPASAETANQRFHLVFRGDESTVVAAGPIRGVGAVVDQEGGSESSFPVAFVFPDGTVFLTVTTVEESFDFNPVACVVRVSLVEDFEITGGTDRYGGATGSGRFTGRGTLLLQRDAEGNCLGPESGAQPVFAVSVLRGTGYVTLPQAAAA